MIRNPIIRKKCGDVMPPFRRESLCRESPALRLNPESPKPSGESGGGKASETKEPARRSSTLLLFSYCALLAESYVSNSPQGNAEMIAGVAALAYAQECAFFD